MHWNSCQGVSAIINYKKIIIKNMFTTIISVCAPGVSGVNTGKLVSVTEGDSVTLNIQRDDEIEWRFGQKDILLAEIKQNNKNTFYEDSADGRFRGRLKLDNQTGSLTITNTRTTDSGDYNVTSTKTRTSLNTFSLSVFGEYKLSGVNSPFNIVNQVKSSHLYLYSAFNNTNCNKALHNIKIGKLCQ